MGTKQLLKRVVPERLIRARRVRIANQFARMSYAVNATWLGTPALKAPADLWIYQEIIAELRPDLIVETGTMFGGSALYLASICDLVGRGQVVTIDIDERGPYPPHPRVDYWTASSIDPATIDRLREREAETVLVILDSDHSERHVRAELEAYESLVTVGSYLIVEDTNINGHPVLRGYGPGPMEAVDGFMATATNYVIDRSREKFLVTQNPRGYLRRIR
jgi:cephalosporin hydroxylase